MFGLIGLTVVGIGFGIAMAVPDLRTLFDDGRLGTLGLGTLLWVTLVRIPLGTVLLEEVAFRGVLPALFGGGERWRWGPVLATSALFGLWHVLPSLALTQNAAVDAASAPSRSRWSPCWPCSPRLSPGCSSSGGDTPAEA